MGERITVGRRKGKASGDEMRVQAEVTHSQRLGLVVFILASIGGILLIWMQGVKHTLLRQESPSTQSPQEARERTEYRHTDFRGDLVGYAARSAALKSVRSENRADLLTLANAGMILNRRSDFSGDTPEYVRAFDAINRDPAALLAFRELVLYATPAGRIYGLCGLYLKRSASFSLARMHLVQSHGEFVLYKSTYDVVEERDVGHLAERPEDICLEIGRSVR